MSRSLGLREDQREGQVLATLIFRLFPMDPVGCIHEQARSHKGPALSTTFMHNTDQTVGASLLAMGPAQSAKT
jgi:hypothetical protein